MAFHHSILVLGALASFCFLSSNAFLSPTPTTITSRKIIRRPITKLSPTSTPTLTTLFSSGDGDDSASEDIGPLGIAAVGLGLVACPTVLYSEYVLKTTGCGLPAGPGGALGALEGISYLVVAGIFIWSIATKVRTGKGLPSGPAGLLGAVEGLSFLAVLAGVVILGQTYVQYGSIPEAVPVDGGRCSGI